MARYLSFGVVFALIAGCAAPAANLPVPRLEQPSQPHGLYIKVFTVPGWVQAPAPDSDGNMIMINKELQAQVLIGVFPRKDGEPRDQIGWFMVKMMSQGAEIGAMALPNQAEAPASLEFSGAAQGRIIQGKAFAKLSGIDGLGLTLIGLWPVENDAAVRPVFDLITGSADILQQ